VSQNISHTRRYTVYYYLDCRCVQTIQVDRDILLRLDHILSDVDIDISLDNRLPSDRADILYIADMTLAS